MLKQGTSCRDIHMLKLSSNQPENKNKLHGKGSSGHQLCTTLFKTFARELTSVSIHLSTVQANYLIPGVNSLASSGMKTQSKGKQKNTGKPFVLHDEI